jgi:non-homologous end joining protein Ku
VERVASNREARSEAIDDLETSRLPTAELGDDRAEALRALALKKAKRGEDVVHVEETEARRPDAEVIDLVAVLKKSLQESGAAGRSRAKSSRIVKPRRSR